MRAIIGLPKFMLRLRPLSIQMTCGVPLFRGAMSKAVQYVELCDESCVISCLQGTVLRRMAGNDTVASPCAVNLVFNCFHSTNMT